MRQAGESFLAADAVLTGDIVLSPGVNIWFGCILRGDLARITLGPNVNLQDCCIVHTDHDEPQTIESGVVVGHGAILHGRRIGTDALIAIGARLLSGCEIGEGSIVAAGTVVTEGKRIPPRSLVMGLPGKVIRPVADEEIARTRAICARYRELAERYARNEVSYPFGPPERG